MQSAARKKGQLQEGRYIFLFIFCIAINGSSLLYYINPRHRQPTHMSFKQLALGSTGIYASYLAMSILSQRLYSTAYPSLADPALTSHFKHPQLIVWCAALMCGLFGLLKGKLDKQPANPIPKRQQIILGLLYTVNILCANYALLYISYLDQTLGRNCRYLAVVLVGVYFSRVKKGSSLKLPASKVVVAGVITAGVLMFTLLGDVKKHVSHELHDQYKGYIILGCSIAADALFSDNQAYAKVNFKPTANHLFTSANLLTFLFVLLISLAKGEFFAELSFCLEHPRAMVDILAMSILQVVGQVSIYYVIANFKQHIFPLISTTRKVFTVLLSILIFGHAVNAYQWLSILMVFGGLGWELKEEIEGKKAKHAEVKDGKKEEAGKNNEQDKKKQ